ncbi:cytochrome c [Paraburkholderia sediminicola]|uniref:c-type cytochrome n=1 Tax=Paraburkholderia sediminicola TaxID=458836 RepID=UPI0038B8D781
MRTKFLLGIAVLACAGTAAWFGVQHRAMAQDAPAQSVHSPAAAAGPAAEAVERGRYLARAGDCIACHTAQGGQPFAGGLAIDTPFGKIVASNITPDKQTGIGDWSEAEFIRAVKQGVGKHGEYLYPAMPYTAYAKVSDQDLRDIKAYLDTVPAVNNKVEANRLPFPFNIRLLMFGWNLLFFDKTPFKADPKQSVEWNRGAYLVQGLGHCASCHTPKNFLGGDGAALQGGELQGWYAPEISGNTHVGLGGWSVDDIAAYLKNGGNNRSVASGPMAEAVTDSTQYLTQADLRAIGVYLKSFPGSDKAAPATLDAGSEPMRLGHQVFLSNCAACHRSNGTGVPAMVSSLSASAGVQQPNPANLLRTILIGSRGAVTESNPTGAAMPNFSWKLSDAEVAAVATYVRNSWGNAADAVTAEQAGKARASLGARPVVTMTATAAAH